LNLRRICLDHFYRAGIFDQFDLESDMPKAVRIAPSIPATSTKSESSEFVSIALFAGIGLLGSLIAVLLGVQGVWY
jgi:hypothetical protein